MINWMPTSKKFTESPKKFTNISKKFKRNPKPPALDHDQLDAYFKEIHRISKKFIEIQRNPKPPALDHDQLDAWLLFVELALATGPRVPSLSLAATPYKTTQVEAPGIAVPIPPPLVLTRMPTSKKFAEFHINSKKFQEILRNSKKFKDIQRNS